MSKKLAKVALEESMRRGAYDPSFWLRFFLRHWFPTPFAPFHLGIIALVTKKVEWLNNYPEAHDFLLNEFRYSADPDDPTSVELPVFQLNADGKIIMVCGDHNNIMVPRGFSKTTLLNGINLYDVCTDGTVFTVYISKSAEHAKMQLGNIKIELETNELLRAAYGNLVPDRSDVEKWQADQLQLLNGAILVARGRGGQVRGLNYRARRPNKIVLDDVEDDGQVESPTVREATTSWFYSAVEKAGVMMDGAEGEEWAQQPLQINNLGTLLGPDCLMMDLTRDPKFSTVRFGAKLSTDPNDTRMLWAFKMSHATYVAERERHRRVGKLAEFTRELDSAIRISDDTIFPSVFIYQPTPLSDLIHRSQALDPAISPKPGRDHTALVVAGRRASDGALWFLDEWGGLGKTPREKVDAFFEYHLKWKTTHNGIESVQYQAALVFLMREEMARRQYFFHIEAIMRGSDERKDTRIVGTLSPRYMNGYIRHLRPLAGLEGNLADWPNGKKDYADAAAMALTLLGESEGLVAPEDSKNPSDYGPLPERLPPVYTHVSNYISKNNRPAHLNPATRYPR